MRLTSDVARRLFPNLEAKVTGRSTSGGRRSLEIGDGEQRAGVQLLQAVGAALYIFGTRRSRGTRCPKCHEFVANRDHSTRQTPGPADVLGFISDADGRELMFWWESKAGSGRMTPDQRQFRERCLRASVIHIVGDSRAVCDWLVSIGRVKAESLPHYRQPERSTL